jgi:hypothetical protein
VSPFWYVHSYLQDVLHRPERRRVAVAALPFPEVAVSRHELRVRFLEPRLAEQLKGLLDDLRVHVLAVDSDDLAVLELVADAGSEEPLVQLDDAPRGIFFAIPNPRLAGKISHHPSTEFNKTQYAIDIV